MGVESVIWHEAESYMSMPQQKPGKSKQDYGTPWELIRAVEGRWGKIGLDLAAHDDGRNAKAPLWFGPSDDFLKQDFTSGLGLPDDLLCWCNPPFEDVGKWAAKWRADAEKGARIIALVPASIGSEWFAEHVFDRAAVIALRPRITFEGCKDPYPKDCMLLVYGLETSGSYFQTWRWK